MYDGVQTIDLGKAKTEVTLTQFCEAAKSIWDLSFELVIFEFNEDQVGKPTNSIAQRSLQAIFVDI